MNKNIFIQLNFPAVDGSKFSFFEIFEIQLFFFAVYAQYNIFYKRNGRIPFYDEKHNIVVNNFSKEELVEFIRNNFYFLSVFFIINIISWFLLFGSIAWFFLAN